MANNLCAPPSSLYQPLFNSLSSSHAFRLPAFPPQSKASLQLTHVNLHDPDGKLASGSSSSPKSDVWVNPRNPRASELLKVTEHAKYSSLLKAAEALNSCAATEEQVSRVLSGLGDHLFFRDAVDLFNRLKNPNVALHVLRYFLRTLNINRPVVLFSLAMKVLRNCGEMDEVEKLFDEMLQRGLRPNHFIFSIMISCAKKCQLPQKAAYWFEKMPTFGITPNAFTYSIMIDAYGRVGDAGTALSLYDRAKAENVRLDAEAYTTLIKVCGISGDYDECLHVYAEMKAQRVEPKMITYNTLLGSMAVAKRPRIAKMIYEEMVDRGISPNYGTYAGLLRAYGKARKGGDALTVYREMKEKGMTLTIKLFNILLSMCAALGYVDEAMEILEDMRSCRVELDVWSFCSLVTLFSSTGRISEAESTLKSMIEAGFEPNIFVLTSLIQCYGNAQRIDDVVKAFNIVLELGLNPDDRLCGCLLSVVSQTPAKEVGKVVECIERGNPKLGYVVKLLVQGGQCTDVTFRELASDLLNSISYGVKKPYCNGLIDLCVNLDLYGRACELLDLGLSMKIYKDMQSRSSTQWSLCLKGLSLGAALTTLHVWINDLSKEMESGERLPPLLRINTGHGKHHHSDMGLARMIEAHLKAINSPFFESLDEDGWFTTSKADAEAWLKARKATEEAAA